MGMWVAYHSLYPSYCCSSVSLSSHAWFFLPYSLALSLSCVFHVHLSLPLSRCHRFARARWAIPDFTTHDCFYGPVKDAVKSVTTLFEALGWMEAARPAPPPLAVFMPTATQEDANKAVVKAFFAQSSLAMEGFHQGGVMPFWESNEIMSVKSLLSVTSERIQLVLKQNPRALLIKSDPGSTSLFMSGVKKYFMGLVDSWSPEEPCSRQSLKPLKSWSSFPSILVKSSIDILASGHRVLNLQEIRDPPSERASLLSLSLSLSLSRVGPLPTYFPRRTAVTSSRCGNCQ